MQVLLQHKFTACYFQTLDRWTPLQAQGVDFGTFEKAVAFANGHKLVNVQVAVWCVPGGQKFLLPMRDPDEAQSPNEPTPSP